MRITAVHLVTRRLAAQQAFYSETLGLPLVEARSGVCAFQAGATRLTFEATERDDALYHLAFNIPRNLFAAAHGWIAARVPLLTQDGRDSFHAESWNADNLYFLDPAGNILELIARHTLQRDASGDFGPQHLLCVSEIGLAVDDPPAQAAALTAALDIAAYQENSDIFIPVGDEHGLLIVVKTGRHWFPTETGAVVAPTRLTLQGTRATRYRVPQTPYEIEAPGAPSATC